MMQTRRLQIWPRPCNGLIDTTVESRNLGLGYFEYLSISNSFEAE